MRRLISFLLTVHFCGFSVMNLHAQNCASERYLEPIFTDVTVHSGVVYGDADPYGPLTSDELEMDIYEPDGDTIMRRPLIVFQHGGVFLVGWESQPPIPQWAEYYAKRGYVVASIEYRLGFNLTSTESAERAVYRAGQDLGASVRYLVDNFAQYRIDTTMIILAGTSSGAIACNHYAYYEPSERPASTYGFSQEPEDLGCGTCSGNTNYNNQYVPVDAVVSYWGAVYDTSYIGGDKRVPILMLHGTEDETVTPYYDAPYSADALFPSLYGSVYMEQRLNNLGIYNEFHWMVGAGHEPEINTLITVQEYVDTMFLYTTPFLHKIVRPEIDTIIGGTFACLSQQVTYSVENATGSEYCWNVSGGTLIQDNGSSIVVEWTALGNYAVDVMERNYYNASSEVFSIDVTVTDAPPIADFSFEFLNDSTVQFSDSSAFANDFIIDFGDGSDAIVTSPGSVVTHTYLQSGTYSVSVWANNGCATDQATQSVVVDIPIIDDILESEFSNLKVYPIPTTSTLFIEGLSSRTQIEVMTLSSGILRTEFLASSQEILHLNQMASGVYILRFSNENGIGYKRIIVQE